jgi:hypothetical protein
METATASSAAWGPGRSTASSLTAIDGSLWMLEDANPGALIHVTLK